MSIVTNEANDLFGVKDQQKCAHCNYPLRYPFLHWDSFCLCGDCARSARKGLTADLIHIAAIMDLHDAGYDKQTFAREETRKVEKRLNEEFMAREQEGQRIMEEIRARRPGNGSAHTSHK
jgi:hypothetical protein